MNQLFQVLPDFSLYLASTSPRRKQLLKHAGLPFYCISPAWAEPGAESGAKADAYVAYAALHKAKSVSLPEESVKAVVIGADTVVALDSKIMGKPENSRDALKMLEALNGRWHAVYTGVCILLAHDVMEFCEKTAVHFGLWPKQVLRAYVETGEPLDKAGAYGIQAGGAFLADRIEGSWSNVVGLPLSRLLEKLLEAKVIVPRASVC